MSELELRPYTFIDDPSVPEYFIDKLHDVQVINGIVRFVPANFRRDQSGDILGAPPFYAKMTMEQALHAAYFVIERTASGLLLPVVDKARKALRLQ